MRVFIENHETKRFLNAASEWGPRDEAYDFRTPTFAIDLCMMRRLRKVRVIVDTGNPDDDFFLDVHGANRAALQAAITRNKELREEHRVLAAALDRARAERKERKKQFPFKRKSVSSDDNRASP